MTSNPVFGAYKGKNHLCLRLKHFIDFEPKLSARAPCSALEKSLGNLGLGRWTPVDVSLHQSPLSDTRSACQTGGGLWA